MNILLRQTTNINDDDFSFRRISCPLPRLRSRARPLPRARAPRGRRQSGQVRSRAVHSASHDDQRSSGHRRSRRHRTRIRYRRKLGQGKHFNRTRILLEFKVIHLA